MRYYWLILLALPLACTPPTKPVPHVPAALQEPGMLDELSTEVKSTIPRYGRGGDLVEALFVDVLKQDSALATLMRDLDDRQAMHRDSMESVHRFEGQNDSYYGAAKQKAEALSDSTEKAKQLAVLNASRARYDVQMAAIRGSESAYEALRTRTDDLVLLIKLQRTLELMERYQGTDHPREAMMKAEVDRLRALEQRLRAALRP
jgi:hypothetical protein